MDDNVGGFQIHKSHRQTKDEDFYPCELEMCSFSRRDHTKVFKIIMFLCVSVEEKGS